MATAAFIKFVWLVFAIFVIGSLVIIGFDIFASLVAESNARTRKRIECERANKTEDNPAELVKVYFG